MNSTYTNTIGQCKLFNGVSTKQIEKLLTNTPHKINQFDKDDILARQDEPCNRLIILLQGTVKAEMEDPSGKTVKVEDIHSSNPLAILFLFGQENHFPVTATATEPVTAIIFPRQSVVKILQNNEQVLINYLDISAHYASMLSRKLHFISFRTIRQKLAIYFLELTKPDGTHGRFDRTQVALAEYFGVSRPSLARELAHMQADKLVEVHKKEFQIPDRNKLRHIVSF